MFIQKNVQNTEKVGIKYREKQSFIIDIKAGRRGRNRMSRIIT